MKFRSLLLGTAAVFAVAGGAKAADLAAAEAVDYVKVCDAYGAGYYGIPGTDTCLRIGGYVQEDIWYHSDDVVHDINGVYVTVDSPDVPTTYPVHPGFDQHYDQPWEFTTEAGINFTARTMSDLGPVVVFSDWRVNSNNNNFGQGFGNDLGYGYSRVAHPDSYYGAIGPVLFGYTESLFDFGGGWTYDGGFREDLKTDQLRWTYMLGTWGLMLGLEDPRDRYGGHASNATGDFPDIIAALTGGVAGWSWEVTAGVTDRTSGTGWGVSAGATWDLGGGFKLRAQGAYSDNARSFAGGGMPVCDTDCGSDGVWWSALVAGAIALSSNVSAAATVSVLEGPDDNQLWQGEIGAYWAATATSTVGIEFRYDANANDNSNDIWGVHARFESHFGG